LAQRGNDEANAPFFRRGYLYESRGRIVIKNRSNVLFMMGAVVIVLGLGGCASIEEHRTLEGYAPDANSATRLSPIEARGVLQSCDNVSLSSSALQGNITGEDLSLYHDPARTQFIRAGLFDIKIKSIKVAGNKLELVRLSNAGSYSLSLRDVDARIYVGTDGWGHLYPFVALNKNWLLGGFPDDSGGIEHAKQIVNAVFVIKQDAGNDSQDQSNFMKVAQTYREASSKPVFPEEARKFKVQAEAAIRDKDFDGAAASYEEAIKIAPWWPEGHFNRALVLGETGDYETAMLEMKRYLMLVPNAPDARAAQDKIYEWERKAGK
jgi:tetratricopeptide (TPR) repeat protein